MKIYDKYVVDNSNPLGNGRVETQVGVKKAYGQKQYGVRGEYKKVINQDKSRNTANDDVASDLISNGGCACPDDSQGGKY